MVTSNVYINTIRVRNPDIDTRISIGFCNTTIQNMASIATSTSHAVKNITDLSQWTTFLTQPANLVVAFFWAEFHEPSKKNGQMDKLFTALAMKHSDQCSFVKIDVEQVPDVVDMYPVTDVPTFVFLRPGKTVKVLGTMEGK